MVIVGVMTGELRLRSRLLLMPRVACVPFVAALKFLWWEITIT